MTLFHLRMHDLKQREFSLRRYCRDSGREVCHSTRKRRTPLSQQRPGFQRSLTNALHSMRPKFERNSSGSQTRASLARADSGYGSMQSVEFVKDDGSRSLDQDEKSPEKSTNENLINLEFSNYAMVGLKRTGASSKRYEFEYWGAHYAWKCVSRKDRGFKEVSFHLTKAGSDQILAYVVAATLTPGEAEEENRKGGWIPPCSMWIADENVIRAQKDVADVVISTGLMALVDTSIRARFRTKAEKPVHIPIPKLPVDVEVVGPRRILSDVFGRKERSSNSWSRPSSSSRPSTAGTGVTVTTLPSSGSRSQPTNHHS